MEETLDLGVELHRADPQIGLTIDQDSQPGSNHWIVATFNGVREVELFT